MMWIKLLVSAHVNGLLRHPHEGVLPLSDEEGGRLIEGGVGEDVSADFADADRTSAETLQEGTAGAPETIAPVHPHQSEVAPQANDAPAPPASENPKPRARKAAANQE